MALDGDLTNTNLKNLKLISGREAGYMAKMSMFYDNAELNEISSNVARLETTIHKLKEEKHSI